MQENSILMKLIRGEMPTDLQIAEELTEVCYSVHASCNTRCPVFRINGNSVPNSNTGDPNSYGCDCFKDGSKMLTFIREKQKPVKKNLTINVNAFQKLQLVKFLVEGGYSKDSAEDQIRKATISISGKNINEYIIVYEGGAMDVVQFTSDGIKQIS